MRIICDEKLCNMEEKFFMQFFLAEFPGENIDLVKITLADPLLAEVIFADGKVVFRKYGKRHTHHKREYCAEDGCIIDN